MRLRSHSHGKARVRVARVERGARETIRELTVEAIVRGAFDRSFTDGDNTGVVATDTIKNLAQIVARENVAAGPEAYARALAATLLERYGQVAEAELTLAETVWDRAVVAGAPHAHTFVLRGNGRPTVHLVAGRDGARLRSGIEGWTILKTTQSGWTGFVQDEVTTLAETTDRIAATALDASWSWAREPSDFAASNARVTDAMLAVFATTYSRGIQDSLYRMGGAALEAVPEIGEMSLSAPNKHYLPIDLSRFGLDGGRAVFTPTDEPAGQIECVICR